MKRGVLIAILGPSLLVVQAACRSDSPSSPTPPAAPVASLTLRSITPAPRSTLPHGQTTSFQVTLAYDLGTATSGSIGVLTLGILNSMVVLIREGGTHPVNSSRGETTISFPVNIPDSAAGASLGVNFNLTPAGSSDSVASFSLQYTVAP